MNESWLSRKKGNLILTNEVAERRTRGGFEWQRLDEAAMETKEGLRWADVGDREGFGWVDDGGREGIGVTNGGRRRGIRATGGWRRRLG